MKRKNVRMAPVILLSYLIGAMSAVSFTALAEDTADKNAEPATTYVSSDFVKLDGVDTGTVSVVNEEVGESTPVATFQYDVDSNQLVISPVDSSSPEAVEKTAAGNEGVGAITAVSDFGGAAHKPSNHVPSSSADPTGLDGDASDGNVVAEEGGVSDETLQTSTDTVGWWSNFTNSIGRLADKAEDKYNSFWSDSPDPSEESVVLEPTEVVSEDVESTVEDDLPEPLDTSKAEEVPVIEAQESVQVQEAVAVVPNWQSYADWLIEHPDLFKNEVLSLAKNMVFEARNQTEFTVFDKEYLNGMDAVMDVTIKRLDKHHRGKTTIGGVVYDDWQFTWVHDAVPDVLLDEELHLFQQALAKAEVALFDYMNGEYVFSLASSNCPEGATHYHKTDITPHWQDDMRSDCGVVGHHHFWEGN